MPKMAIFALVLASTTPQGEAIKGTSLAFIWVALAPD
jgi:hypothetical protein